MRMPSSAIQECIATAVCSDLATSAKAKNATEHAHTLFLAKNLILRMLSSRFGFAEVARSLQTAVAS